MDMLCKMQTCVSSRATECGAFIAPIKSGYPEIIKRVCDRNTVQATADHLTTKDGSAEVMETKSIQAIRAQEQVWCEALCKHTQIFTGSG